MAQTSQHRRYWQASLCTSGRGIALSLVQRLDGAGAFHRPGIRLFAQSQQAPALRSCSSFQPFPFLSSWLNNTASAAAISFPSGTSGTAARFAQLHSSQSFSLAPLHWCVGCSLNALHNHKIKKTVMDASPSSTSKIFRGIQRFTAPVLEVRDAIWPMYSSQNLEIADRNEISVIVVSGHGVSVTRQVVAVHSTPNKALKGGRSNSRITSWLRHHSRPLVA